MNLLVSLVCSGSVLKCFQVLLKTAFKRVFLTHWSYLPLNTFLFIGRTLSFPNSVANSGPFESSMPIQMPEFSFFPANRGRPYADSWHCQNISVYFLSLPGEREKSLPTVREDSKKKKLSKKKVPVLLLSARKKLWFVFQILFLKIFYACLTIVLRKGQLYFGDLQKY